MNDHDNDYLPKAMDPADAYFWLLDHPEVDWQTFWNDQARKHSNRARFWTIVAVVFGAIAVWQLVTLVVELIK